VISVAALCLAQGLDPSEITAVANLAGGLVCEEVGVVPVSKERLKEEIFKSNILK
jgi:bifunctional ADP-heptose synthase (sugar kinase/adenylyltransferase)